MSDKMQPAPFNHLTEWILSEFVSYKTIFEIPSEKFFKIKNNRGIKLFGEFLDTPLGPAAGPHTQLCQNIISAYLTGGRFFELKTVQKLDDLKIDKPCIDAGDEGYNVEWSQELSLDESYDEYLKAWILIHFLKELLNLSNSERGFIFNMSVGYDLAGIKTDRMDRFIEELKNASKNRLLADYKKMLIEVIRSKEPGWFESAFGISKSRLDEIVNKTVNISPLISSSVTLSTMHGCPPGEIEAIAKYLIHEKNLHTYVKLNPTLLGYEFVAGTLHRLGYKYIEMDRSSFDHDIQYKDAVPMLNRLRAFASAHNKVFGIKLSNTLGVKNSLHALPGEDMYMSGRSLFPLTINLASKLATEFNGEINISFSGGADSENITDILQCGISPVTFVTDLLKPGGYLRIKQLAEAAEKFSMQGRAGDKINLTELKKAADASLSGDRYSKEKRLKGSIKIQKNLPLFDCFIAPCQEACPIHQDVASYIKLVEQKRYEEAFELIVSKNPLPHITGYICDHQCMYHCTRMDYEDPVLIRDLKKCAAENGFEPYLNKFKENYSAMRNEIKTAVIGAGPSGLSAAYFLAKAGFDVTVFEKEMNAGGITRNVLPEFRLPEEAIEKDLKFIEMHGIKFIFGIDPGLSIRQLKKEGYKYIYVAIGAGASREFRLDGENENIYNAIDFLKEFRGGGNTEPGKSVAVIGGGNSAMDSARAAKRCSGVEKVFIIYRRTKDEMPADREEFYSALGEGIGFHELLLPVKFKDKVLTCQKMKLGGEGSDGRRTAVPVENEFVELTADTLISAIGEQVDKVFLTENRIGFERDKVKVSAGNETDCENVFIGGDALRGPSTVVESIADGRKAADAIIIREKLNQPQVEGAGYFGTDEKIRIEYSGRRGEILGKNSEDLSAEAGRCLGCNFICNKCVDVCPNRANIKIETAPAFFKDTNQILHIDSLCNECGNCATFCPYQGSPYKEKTTLFRNEKEFNESRNDGFYISKTVPGFEAVIRMNEKSRTVRFNKDGGTSVSSFKDLPGSAQLINLIGTVLKNYFYIIQN